MNKIEFNNLNKTPVRTSSWLKINDVNIVNYEMPEIKDFAGVNIIGENLDGVSIEKLQKENIFPLDKKFIYGVSEELIIQGEKEFNEGYLVKIDKNVKVSEPIIIEFNMDENNTTLVDNIIVVSEENSKAKIVVKYKSIDKSAGYHNGVCKIFANDNSEVQVVKVNLLNNNTAHFDSNLSDISYGALVDFVSIDLGGKYSINNYHGDLVEENSKSTLGSIYLGEDKKIIDMNYVMTHRGRRTESEIITKGALNGESSKIFRGTLDFKTGSAKSVGAEDEYCMMLSPNVKAKALPLLLCSEDDVQGQHAAASGKIDDDKLFYLMSRGISREDSITVIVEGSFNPIIDKINVDSIREEILNEIKVRLSNAN